jgi:hypothetical protein
MHTLAGVFLSEKQQHFSEKTGSFFQQVLPEKDTKISIKKYV